MAADYELHVAVNWYLYCMGCDLLTKIQRSTQNHRLAMIAELCFRSSCHPLLRITYCRKCALPFAATIASASWTDILLNRTLIQESKLWKRLLVEHSGLVPVSPRGSYFVLENPNRIFVSAEFSYQVTDYGWENYSSRLRYPALMGREFGRFEALAVIDEAARQNAQQNAGQNAPGIIQARTH